MADLLVSDRLKAATDILRSGVTVVTATQLKGIPASVKAYSGRQLAHVMLLIRPSQGAG